MEVKIFLHIFINIFAQIRGKACGLRFIIWGGFDVAVLKACPRCRKLIPHGLSYCEACTPIAEAERQAKRERKVEYLNRKRNRKYNSRRDPKYQAFYTSKPWRMTSRKKLEDVEYKCEARLEGCTKLAVEVHHIKPIQTPEGWELRLEWDNLEAVCTACHNRRHPEKFKRKDEPCVVDLRKIR